MSRRRLFALLASALLALLALAPRAAAPTAPLTVLAAASLKESLGRVAAAWQAKGNGAVTISFDATSRLAKQVEAGAPADLFFSADLQWMDWLAERGLIAADTRVSLLGNALVVVVPTGAAFAPTEAAQLADPALVRLALAGESVPAGRYARASLGALGVWEAVKDRVVVGDDVRATLAWVAQGEAGAGVVYATDVAVEPRVKVAFRLPPGSHPPIVYPAAVLSGAADAADARRFLDFCRSDEAMAIFRAAGFTEAPR